MAKLRHIPMWYDNMVMFLWRNGVISQKSKRYLFNLYEIRHFRYAKEKSVRRGHRKALLKKHGGCAWCGDTRNLTLDHIVPVALGGRNHISNFQLLCWLCNNKKGHNRISYPFGRTENHAKHIKKSPKTPPNTI